MEYKGKLYGHLGGKRYFDTGKTADDWDALEKRIAELESELESKKCDHSSQQWQGNPLQRICKKCGENRTKQNEW